MKETDKRCTDKETDIQISEKSFQFGGSESVLTK